jgi:hypothetical protein
MKFLYSVGLILARQTGNGNTVTTADVSVVHPFAPVAVTEYVVVACGATVTTEAVSPELQEYCTPPVAVSVVLVPGVMARLPEILTTGGIQIPGYVVTGTDSSLEIAPSKSQLQRVLIVSVLH